MSCLIILSKCQDLCLFWGYVQTYSGRDLVDIDFQPLGPKRGLFCTQIQILHSSKELRIVTQKVGKLDLLGNVAMRTFRPLVPRDLCRQVFDHLQRCGTVTIFYGSGSGSYFWKVMVLVPTFEKFMVLVPVLVPTFEKLWFRLRFQLHI